MSDMATTKAVRIPYLVYGTAWKKDQTRVLVYRALEAGFRGVDTAAQPKHYQEDLVGEGIREAILNGVMKRDELYIQTKYTSIHGQDPNRMPYNPKSSIADQVAASVASSLKNLRPTEDAQRNSTDAYIDCLVLHSPFPSLQQTLEAWRVMETHVPHPIRTLGISNIYDIDALRSLYQSVRIPPSVVQNRFYPETGYDTQIRQFCREKGITYQSFWTLTGNPRLLRSEPVGKLAEAAGVSREVALYGLVLGLDAGMSVLDGTTKSARMVEDLKGVEMVRKWSGKAPEGWSEILQEFKALVGDSQSWDL